MALHNMTRKDDSWGGVGELRRAPGRGDKEHNIHGNISRQISHKTVAHLGFVETLHVVVL